MIVEQTKIFKLSDEELTTINNSVKVLDNIVWNLKTDESICLDGTYYDAQFITDVYNFLCDLRGILTVEKRAKER